MLVHIGSIKDIYNRHFSMYPIEEKIENRLNRAYSKIDFDFKVITINDPRSVEGVTPILYCRGDLSLLNADKTISFVGTCELYNPTYISIEMPL